MEHSAWEIQGTYPPGGPAELTESARLFGFWRRPEATMRDIVARPFFIAPLALACVAGMAFAMVAMPPAFRQSSGLPMALAGTAVSVVVRVLILTGLLSAIVAVLARTTVDFRQLFAVTCYSRVPGVLFTGLAIFLILLRRANGLGDSQPFNPNITNVAYFLESARLVPSSLYSLANSVDVSYFSGNCRWSRSGLKATSRVFGRRLSRGPAWSVCGWFMRFFKQLGFSGWRREALFVTQRRAWGPLWRPGGTESSRPGMPRLPERVAPA